MIIARQTEQRHQRTLEMERRELETVKQLLKDVPKGPVHDALLNTWSNVFMLWKDGGKTALKHHGKVLSILERNQLQHVLNRNINDESMR